MSRLFALFAASSMLWVASSASALVPVPWVPTQSPVPLPVDEEGKLGMIEHFDPQAAGWYDRNASWPIQGLWCDIDSDTGYQQVLFAGAQPPDTPNWESDPVRALDSSDQYEPRRADRWENTVVHVDYGPTTGWRSDVVLFQLVEERLGVPGEPVEPDLGNVDVKTLAYTDGGDDFPMIMGPGVVWQAQLWPFGPWDIVFANHMLWTHRVLTEEYDPADDETRPSIWWEENDPEDPKDDKFWVAFEGPKNGIVVLELDAEGNTIWEEFIEPDRNFAYGQPAVSNKGVLYHALDLNSGHYGIGFREFGGRDAVATPSDIGSECADLIQPRMGGDEAQYAVFLGAGCNPAVDGDRTMLYVAKFYSSDLYGHPIDGNPIVGSDRLAHGPAYDMVGPAIVFVDGDRTVRYLLTQLH